MTVRACLTKLLAGADIPAISGIRILNSGAKWKHPVRARVRENRLWGKLVTPCSQMRAHHPDSGFRARVSRVRGCADSECARGFPVCATPFGVSGPVVTRVGRYAHPAPTGFARRNRVPKFPRGFSADFARFSPTCQGFPILSRESPPERVFSPHLTFPRLFRNSRIFDHFRRGVHAAKPGFVHAPNFPASFPDGFSEFPHFRAESGIFRGFTAPQQEFTYISTNSPPRAHARSRSASRVT